MWIIAEYIHSLILKTNMFQSPQPIAIPKEYTEPTTNNWQIFLKYLIISKDGSTSSNLIISGFWQSSTTMHGLPQNIYFNTLTIEYKYARSSPYFEYSTVTKWSGLLQILCKCRVQLLEIKVKWSQTFCCPFENYITLNINCRCSSTCNYQPPDFV